MTEEEHKARHVALHRSLDELVADWIFHTGSFPSHASVVDLINWSYSQTKNPVSNIQRYINPNTHDTSRT